MRNALLCSVFVVTGLLMSLNVPNAIPADEGQTPAGQHEQMTPPVQHDGDGKPLPMCGCCGPHARCVLGVLKFVLLVWLVCNILLASWIFADIRKLGQGHGIFVALALLAGFPAAILYAIVRIGDRKA
jgi:hypothetical protein